MAKKSTMSMKVSFKPKLLDKKALTERMQEICEVQLRQAAREFLRAIVEHIPIWTGMARGAFKYARGRSGDSAGQFLGTYLDVQIPIGNTRTYGGGPRVIRPDKTPEAGGAMSRFTLSASDGRYRFTFNTNVVHLILNDLVRGSPTTNGVPWRLMQTGQAAFVKYIETQLAKRLRKALKEGIQESLTASSGKWRFNG